MSAPQVLKAQYADLKTVKTRSTVQIVLEMPIEALTDIVALLGAPVPGNSTWVAIARLKDGATAAKEPEALPSPQKENLARLAGILCQKSAFQKFMAERTHANIQTAEDCAKYVRIYCDVNSRADLDHNVMAAGRFNDLRTDYKIWMNGEIPA